ncbi:hypothetical protein [Psychroflexus sp. MBR-150]|jgi:hypothetical protein
MSNFKYIYLKIKKGKVFCLVQLLFFLVFFTSNGQNNFKNIENFKSGTTLIFQDCEIDSIYSGDTGENVTWDFSKLKPKKNKIIEEIVNSRKVPESKNFPKSNLVEKYSNGDYVFLNKDKNKTFLVGFISNEHNLEISYTKPMLIAQRPFSYGDKLGENYNSSYNVNGLNFSGNGNVTIEADGYGTLILPDRKINDVLRINITQKQENKVEQYNSTSEMLTTTYVWFDRTHNSALLKITQTKSQYHSEKQIEYLLKETSN